MPNVPSSPRTRRYELHGLVVEAEIPLDAAETGASPDHRSWVTEAKTVDGPPPGRVLSEFHVPGMSYWVAEDPESPHRWRFRFERVCGATVDRDCGEIALEAPPEVDRGLLAILLGGGILGHLLSAREGPVLHASAIEVDGRAVALVGPSGGGKSTVAALLCADGARLVTDDTLRVGVDDDKAWGFRGTNVVRLRGDTAGALASTLDGDMKITADGRLAVAPPPATESRLPLECVVVPVPSYDARRVAVERLRGSEAVRELLRNPRVSGWQGGAPVRHHFAGSAALAAAVPILRAEVPWGPPFAPGLADELLVSAMEASATSAV
jgi:hypothetical protein